MTCNLSEYNKTQEAREASRLRMKKNWQNPEYVQNLQSKQKEHYSNPKNSDARIQQLMNNDSEVQSARGKKSRIYENKVAETLSKEFDHVFLPNEVCDRICIRDGRIYLVEIKKPGDVMKPKQVLCKNLVPYGYILID